MAKKWSGEGANKLPTQQIEPYRLWFEFLCLASKDSWIQINTRLYASWDNYASTRFDVWWTEHWQKLFAVDIGVYEITAKACFYTSTGRDLVIRVPLYQSPKVTLKQVEQLLIERGASNRLKDMPSGQFRLDVGKNFRGKDISPATRFLRNLRKVRLLLNLYRFWVANDGLPNNKRLDKTAVDFWKWASSWNAKIKAKKDSKRRPIEIPYAINGYVKYLEKRGTRQRLPKAHEGSVVEVEHISYRRQIDRYLKKAQKIAVNVSKGQFPGAYE